MDVEGRRGGKDRSRRREGRSVSERSFFSFVWAEISGYFYFPPSLFYIVCIFSYKHSWYYLYNWNRYWRGIRAGKKKIRVQLFPFGEKVNSSQRWTKQDYSGGSLVKNLPANAEDMGLTPGLGRSDMPWGQLSPCPTTTSINYTEPVPRACALQWEATAMKSPHTAMKSNSLSKLLEKARAQQQIPSAAKNKPKKLFFKRWTQQIIPLYHPNTPVIRVLVNLIICLKRCSKI